MAQLSLWRLKHVSTSHVLPRRPCWHHSAASGALGQCFPNKVWLFFPYQGGVWKRTRRCGSFPPSTDALRLTGRVMALRCAAIHGHRELAQRLAENGVPAKPEMPDGTSVLMQTGLAGHLEMATDWMETLTLLQMMSTAHENRMATMGVPIAVLRCSASSQQHTVQLAAIGFLNLHIHGCCGWMCCSQGIKDLGSEKQV